jgi:predicted DCC family thiol-disulfide oxidoreductase YuxK
MSTEAIIVFDGVCVLCNGWVRFLLRHDSAGRYRFAAMQSVTGAQLLAEHGLNPHDPSSFLLVEEGIAYCDSGAILRVLAGLGGAWRVTRIGNIVPRWLRDPAYRFIARHRYRIFGRHDACLLPDAKFFERFLP